MKMKGVWLDGSTCFSSKFEKIICLKLFFYFFGSF